MQCNVFSLYFWETKSRSEKISGKTRVVSTHWCETNIKMWKIPIGKFMKFFFCCKIVKIYGNLFHLFIQKKFVIQLGSRFGTDQLIDRWLWFWWLSRNGILKHFCGKEDIPKKWRDLKIENFYLFWFVLFVCHSDYCTICNRNEPKLDFWFPFNNTW